MDAEETASLKLGLGIIDESTNNIGGDEQFRNLLESLTCNALEIKPQSRSSTSGSQLNSKPDVLKAIKAHLVKALAIFVRHDFTTDAVEAFLLQECKYSKNRAKIFGECYVKHKPGVDTILGSIGTHLPHLVNVRWSIDYIVKTNNLDRTSGPLFRIGLTTSQFNDDKLEPQKRQISFTCDSQELQDLIYKLKDATRHCQRLIVEH